MLHELPDISFDYDALEPHIDAQTMEIHHSKHHAGYVKKLNDALEKHPEIAEKPLAYLLESPDEVPEDIRGAVRNNGGGHYNHSLFWKILSPDGGGTPKDTLLERINKSFGSFDTFREGFTNAAMSRFGSGWAWLVVDPDSAKLRVISTPNQDTTLMNNLTPILGLDVWEHAYYLNYQNKRGDYISAWWNIVNWDQVQINLNEATG